MTPMLSRAKIRDTGHWIEGYYACESNHACFQNEMKYTHFIFKDEFMDWGIGGLVQYEVIPETVGRYTGLTDKNGKKIFEGDIVRVTDDDGDTEFSDGGNGYVDFDYGLWYVHGRVSNGLYDISNVYHIEVIGNIHDSPELLGSDV